MSDALPALNTQLLPRGLRLLILLRYKAFFRRMFSGKPKRRLVSILGVAIIALLLVPRIMSRQAGQNQKLDPDAVHTWLPLVLIALAILRLSIRVKRDPVTFQPAEIDLVVPGPFSRRQLVLYQVLYQIGPQVLVGLWVAIAIRTGGAYISNALGVTLLFFAINLLSGIVNIAIGILQNKSRFIVPSIFLAAVLLIGAAVMMAPPFPAATNPKDWLAWASALRHTTIIDIICLPTRPYAELLIAPTIVAALPWAVLTAAMDIGLIALFIALDRGEIESLVTKSQERLAKLEKARRPGLRDPEAAARREIPMLPRMGGIGPLLWRQLATVYRLAGRGAIIIIPLVILASTITLGRFVFSTLPPEATISFMLGIAAMGGFLLSRVLRCDFRSDLDHMDMLKSIPLSPMAIVLGQVAAPIAIAAAVQILLGIGFAIGSANPLFALYGSLGALAMIPLNAVMVAIENTVFLVAPVRSARSAMQGGLDPSQLGRTAIISLAKLAVIGVTFAVIGFPTWGIYMLAGPVPAIIVALALIGIALYGFLAACAWAFVAFNVAEDQPA